MAISGGSTVVITVPTDLKWHDSSLPIITVRDVYSLCKFCVFIKFLCYLQILLHAHWLIFIVNKQTEA